MLEDELTKTIVHLAFKAARGKRKAQAKFNAYASDPSTRDLAERCRIAALATMTPRAPRPRPKKLGESSGSNSGSVLPHSTSSQRVQAPRSFMGRLPEHASRCSVCGAPALPGDSVCYRHAD